MKRTTLIIDENCFYEIKQLASKEARTLSEVVNECLRTGIEKLRSLKKSAHPVSLPTFSMGRPYVNLADRDLLEQVMEKR